MASGKHHQPRGTRSLTMQKVSLRVTPRLVLEVNRHNAICVATNVPEFYNARGDLNIRDLRAHVKARMISSQFCGYVLVSLLDSEDQVDHLNIFPHVFSERMILYKPNNVNLMEMCALLSMIENAKSPSIGLCREVLGRLTLLHSKCNNLDSLFLYNGARTLLSTLVKYHDLEEGASTPGPWNEGLSLFKLHKELKRAPSEARDLMQSLFLTSGKMGCLARSPKDYCADLNKEEDANSGFTFNLFYQDSLLTKHFQCQTVLQTLRRKCLGSDTVSKIIP